MATVPEIQKIRDIKENGIRKWICVMLTKKNPHSMVEVFPNRMWIMWITYRPRRCSPTFTISPAPIVINRSPFIQFFSKNFSISSKEGK